MTRRRSSTSVQERGFKTMTNATRILRAAAAVLLLAGVSGAAFAAGPPGMPPKPPQGTPQPQILVVCRAAILRGSVVGQNIMKQVQQLTIAAENGLKGKDQALPA